MPIVPAEELYADLVEIERLITLATRPHVRALLTTYAEQLRSEHAQVSKGSNSAAVSPNSEVPPALQPTAETATPAVIKSTPAPAAAPPPPKPVLISCSGNATKDGTAYVPIGSHSWDQDGYGKEPNNVYVYILSGFDGIGEQKESVTCDFTKNSFDLKIHDFNGKSYRLLKNNLDKNIIVEESKVIVKKNSIKICLRKEKGKYGYDTWTDLTAKRQKTTDIEKDPGAGIMDLMKQMYEEGDDQMKKTIGEAMLKSREKQQTGLSDDAI